MGRTDFSDQIKRSIIRYKVIGYDLNVMRQTACLVSHVNDFNTRKECFTAKPNFSNRVIGIINFGRLFPNFIVDTVNYFPLISMPIRTRILRRL